MLLIGSHINNPSQWLFSPIQSHWSWEITVLFFNEIQYEIISLWIQFQDIYLIIQYVENCDTMQKYAVDIWKASLVRKLSQHDFHPYGGNSPRQRMWPEVFTRHFTYFSDDSFWIRRSFDRERMCCFRRPGSSLQISMSLLSAPMALTHPLVGWRACPIEDSEYCATLMTVIEDIEANM